MMTQPFIEFNRASPDISALVTHSAAQTMTTGSTTALAFDTERFDTNAIHDTVTNNSRLTAKTAGKYLVFASVSWVANATGTRGLSVRKNGSDFLASVLHAANDEAGTGTEQVIALLTNLAVNDYLEAMVVQTSGGNLDVAKVADYSPEFGMSKILA